MGADVEIAASRREAPTGESGVIERLGARLADARVPLNDRRFWLIQALVFAIAGLHNALEGIQTLPQSDLLCFVPTSFFFMPVLLAAAAFGRRGAVATAIWCTALTLPNSFVWHSGFERYGEMAQIAFVDIAGVLLGTRVDQERHAYARVAAVSRALELSQLKYRLLFESAREGIMVLDASGRIVESNAAARALAQPPHRELHLRELSDVFPPEAARQIMEQASHPEGGTRAIALGERGADETWVEPLCTRLDGDPPSTQVVLRNVTQQRRRQIGLETYTAQVHKAQEDERRRIAQEIHDETVQSLVMLCRELDDLEDRSAIASPAIAARLHETRDRAEQIVATLRVLIRGIRPPLLDDLGLAPAVQRLLADLSAHSSIRTNLAVTGTARRAPHAVELAMLRIAQEALHNAERHGVPSHIDVHVTYEYGSVEMEIRDDGRGFVSPHDPSDLAKAGNWGVVGMYERAREVGGELHVSSTPGVGTIVSAVFAI
jgi:PAS domain S-box-containing protein